MYLLDPPDIFSSLFYNQAIFQKYVWYFFDQVATDAKSVLTSE